MKRKGIKATVIVSVVLISIYAVKGSYLIKSRMSDQELKLLIEENTFHGNWEEAIEASKILISKNEGDSDLHYALGQLYHKKYLEQDEAAQWKRASDIVLNPRYKQKGSYEEDLERYGSEHKNLLLALSEYRKALQYDPNHWRSRFKIGANYIKNGAYFEGIEELEKVLSIDPDNISAYSIIGEAYAKIGNYSAAEYALEKVVDYDQKNPRKLYYLGLVYRVQGKSEKALEVVEKLKKWGNQLYNDKYLMSPEAFDDIYWVIGNTANVPN